MIVSHYQARAKRPLSKETSSVVSPMRVFLLVLLAVFTSEAAVMLLLPYLTAPATSFVSEAIMDACLLIAVLAPLLLWLVVLPLRRLAETRSELLAHILSIQEEERGRIARDLHDGLGQSLTCLTIGLRAIEEGSQDEQVKQQARDLRRLGGETHDEIRRLISGLRPSLLDDLGLAAALERYCSDLQAANRVRVSLQIDGLNDDRLPQAIETTLYRIAQEATTNALRHAAATEIEIQLRLVRGSVELHVRDNGRGFKPRNGMRGPAAGQSLELWSIRERVAMLSGSVQIESGPSQGTLVSVRIPRPMTETDHAKNSSSRGR